MKVSTQQVNRYHMQIEGVDVGEFKKDGEWKGMTCWRSNKGHEVITLDKPHESILSFLGGPAESGLVAASTDVIDLVRKYTATPEASDEQ